MANEIEAPRGVNGKQRDMFLSLDKEGRTVYRYHFNCGRLAAHCFEIASNGPLAESLAHFDDMVWEAFQMRRLASER